jgi:hypothetical protein
MWIAAEQRKDAEVTRLLRRLLVTGDLSSSSPISTPRTPSGTRDLAQPDPEVEIGTGFYYMKLGQPPQQPLGDLAFVLACPPPLVTASIHVCQGPPNTSHPVMSAAE